MEGFTYHSLGEQDFTRIVVVEPGEPADKLQCSLRTICRWVGHSPLSNDDPMKWPTKTSTPEDEVYNALSYVWGSLQPEMPIICDGRNYIISSNLGRALRALRRKEKQLHMWIDAMCINQKNVLERNEQVVRMRQIYLWAEEVCIWLGDEDEETHLVLRLYC